MSKSTENNGNEKKQPPLNAGKFDGKSEADATFKKYSHLLITDHTDIPQPIPIVKINGEDISTEGAITTISGASKSGKSAFTSIWIAGAIATGEYDGLPDLEIMPANGKAVIHFDSEQTRHKHQRNLKSILKRAGLDTCPDNFLSYNIREEEIEKYCAIVSEIVVAAKEKLRGVHMVIIDGGADFIRDVNEPVQSNALVKFFDDLAIQNEAPVIVIVHVNPNSDKERGHFGSQLQRKSESILTIKTQGDISYLEPKFLRNAGKGNIPLIQFIYDKGKGYHVFCGLKTPEEQEQKDLIRLKKVEDLVNIVFAPPTSLGYKEAIEKIMKHSKKQEVTAKGLFKDMKAHVMIVQGEDKNWRFNLEYEIGTTGTTIPV